MMRVAFSTTVCILLLAACSTSGATDPEPGTQQLRVDLWNTGGTGLELNLAGPVGTASQPVTYYIFGNDEGLTDGGMVPLAAQRHDEASFGPLSFGEEINNVDLGPWDGYAHIYLRAIPVDPNIIHELTPGHIYSYYTT